jgi:NAD-dependent dihydropyrimidine dehydrogenase PreA subunit
MVYGIQGYNALSEALRFIREGAEDGTYRVAIDEEFCTGCFACVRACRSQVLGAKKVDDRKMAYVRNAENCVGCLRCFTACLVKAISVAKQQ